MLRKYVLSTMFMLCCIAIVTFVITTNAVSVDNIYSNEKLGIKFVVPEGVNLYTAESPGPMASRITSETTLWLVNSSIAAERINVKVSQFQDATESELNKSKQELDYNPSPIPNYQKISVKFIKIGKQGDKNALEHIHALKQKEPKKLRQIMIIHKGRAILFTCSTSPERFDSADKQFFDLIFHTMEFK